MTLTGKSFIGYTRGGDSSTTFTAFDPSTGDAVAPGFHSATLNELDRAATLADAARVAYGKTSGAERAAFLRAIATNIEALGDELVQRATLETGLPNARFMGERGRTCMQLRMFADLVERGDWVDARLDRPDAARQPIPKPDVRSMLRPLGPVAVFCASNFPLAFSVAGGDTASALAAGCPVIVNAHFAHPGTAELVGGAIVTAAQELGLPEGVFSLVFSTGYEIGQALVSDPRVKAVGFTGSRNGGRALVAIAAARPEPIPVYAEMSSVNPLFVLPDALRERADAIAAGLHGAITTGAGQFCTKPGIVVLPDSPETDAFKTKFATLVQNTPPHPLLTDGIRANFERMSALRSLPKTASAHEFCGFAVETSVYETDAATFLSEPELMDEIFGPTTLLVTAATDDFEKIARCLEGQLTATVHGTADELASHIDLLDVLETKAGRLIFNGFPTGVEVGSAMVHGGPFPATSDSRSTSVGTLAIERFCRQICWQNFPESAVPDELKSDNPLGISRLVDGARA